MEDKKVIVFSYRYGFGEKGVLTEEVEFDADATEDEITKAFADWVFDTVGDYCV